MNEIKEAVESARQAQERALEELDKDILFLRSDVREGKFPNIREERDALRKLADRLTTKIWWEENLRAQR